MQLTKKEFEKLNQFGVIHILLIIRIFLGLFSSFGNISISNYYGLTQLSASYTILVILMILCIILFFTKNKYFVLSYSVAAIIVIAISFSAQAYSSALASLIVEGAFLVYLLVSKRSKVVFKMAKIVILPDDTSQTAPSASAAAHCNPQDITVQPAYQPEAEASPNTIPNTILSQQQIENIAKDLLAMEHDAALIRIGGMQLPNGDKTKILSFYKSLCHRTASPQELSMTGNGNSVKKKFPLWAIILIICATAATVIALLFAFVFFPVTNLSPSSSSLQESSEQNPDRPEVEIPENYSVYEKDSVKIHFLAPLDLTTPDGSDYYYIILKSTSTTRDIHMTIFMYPNSQHEFQAPIGSYEIYIAYGEQWYGKEEMFGPSGNYMKIDSVFRFTETADYYYGHQLDLRNLDTDSPDSIALNYNEFISQINDVESIGV